MALSVPLSRFTPRVGGGSAFYVRHHYAMSQKVTLKGIGYWKDEECRRYPQPQWLVETGWHAQDLDRIIGYLRSGKTYFSCLGYSHCRFSDCRDKNRERNGDSDFTDGVWVWPEGLAHYVEQHSVILPEEIVSTMRSNDWRIPQQVSVPKIEAGVPMFDTAFWEDWSRQRRPWYIIW